MTLPANKTHKAIVIDNGREKILTDAFYKLIQKLTPGEVQTLCGMLLSGGAVNSILDALMSKPGERDTDIDLIRRSFNSALRRYNTTVGK